MGNEEFVKHLEARDSLQCQTSLLLGTAHGTINGMIKDCQCANTREKLKSLHESMLEKIDKIYYSDI